MACQAVTAAAAAAGRKLQAMKVQEALVKKAAVDIDAVIAIDEPPQPCTPARRRLTAQVSDLKTPPPPKKQRTAEPAAFEELAKPAAAPTVVAEQAAKAQANVVYPLVGREDECRSLDCFFEKALTSGAASGGCLYVSGGPGTGKTCSVRSAAGAWQRQRCAATQILEVNCMQLTSRTPTGLLLALGDLAAQRLSSAAAVPLPRRSTHAGLLQAVATRLACLAPSVVVVADEVDQLISRRQGAPGLESVFALARAPGAPAVAFVAIANAVDLMQRGGAARQQALASAGCEALPFQPYEAAQLRAIAKAHFEAAGAAGQAAMKAMGPVSLEIGLRQVSKSSGDCRKALRLCEQALFDVASQAAANEDMSAPADTVSTRPRRSRKVQAQVRDPLDHIPELPIEQQVLLCALASGKGEPMKLSDVRSKHNSISRQQLRQTELATTDQVSTWISVLELHGLLGLRTKKPSRGRRGGAGGAAETIVELAVTWKAVHESIAKASPMLGQGLA